MIDVTVIGTWAVVGLAGEFDLANSEEIRSVVADLIDQGATEVSVDLSRVSFMGAAGLNALCAAVNAVDAVDGRMIIIGASPFIRRVLAITGLDRSLPVTDTTAVISLGTGGRAPQAVARTGLADQSNRWGKRLYDPGGLLSSEPTITERLRRVAADAVRIVPGCDAATVCLLVHGQPRTAAVSDAVAAEVDLAQYVANEGPCLAAAGTLRPVRVDELDDEDGRFTHFAPLGRQLGIRAVLSIPVIVGAHPIGTLNLYSTSAFGSTAETDSATLLDRAVAAQEEPSAGVVP